MLYTKDTSLHDAIENLYVQADKGSRKWCGYSNFDRLGC